VDELQGQGLDTVPVIAELSTVHVVSHV